MSNNSIDVVEEQGLSFAENLVASGVSVIPCRRPGKEPLIPWRGFQERVPETTDLEYWYGTLGRVNWAAVTGRVSGVIVLDFDTPGAYRTWCMRYGVRPVWTVTSGRDGGGVHVWAQYRPDVPSITFDLGDGASVEVKSDGRIAMLPGALHTTGRTYQVDVADTLPDEEGWDLASGWGQGYLPRRADLPVLPDAFLGDLQAQRARPGAAASPASAASAASSASPAPPTDGLAGFQRAARGAEEGARHETLMAAAGHYARCIPDARAYADMMHLLAGQCDPPYGDTPEGRADLEAIIRDGWSYAHADPVGDVGDDPWRAWDAVGSTDRTWLVDGVLPDGALSILGGAPKAGKSTLARELAVAVATGGTWLGRAVPTPGAVLYVVGYGEGRLGTIADTLRALGAPAGNPYLAVGRPDLEAAVARFAPRLIVLDTLGKAVMGRDTQDYAAMAAALEPIARLAQESGACVLALHHTGKHADQTDPVGALLGSQQIAGTVDTILTLRRDGKWRILAGVGREVGDLDALALDFDGGRYSVAGNADTLAAEARMADILEAVANGATRLAEIAEVLEVPRRTLQRDLAGLVRGGRLVCGGGARAVHYGLPG